MDKAKRHFQFNRQAVHRLLIIFIMFLTGQAGAQPAEWLFDKSTENHIIIIQTLANPVVNGKELPSGSWIGVFYDSDKSELECAGYVQWFGKSTTVAAFGKEGDAPGFKTGESFKYKMAIPITDSKTYCIVDDVQVTYQPVDGQLISDTDAYVEDGVSSLNTLVGTSECFK